MWGPTGSRTSCSMQSQGCVLQLHSSVPRPSRTAGVPRVRTPCICTAFCSRHPYQPSHCVVAIVLPASPECSNRRTLWIAQMTDAGLQGGFAALPPSTSPSPLSSRLSKLGGAAWQASSSISRAQVASHHHCQLYCCVSSMQPTLWDAPTLCSAMAHFAYRPVTLSSTLGC